MSRKTGGRRVGRLLGRFSASVPAPVVAVAWVLFIALVAGGTLLFIDGFPEASGRATDSVPTSVLSTARPPTVLPTVDPGGGGIVGDAADASATGAQALTDVEPVDPASCDQTQAPHAADASELHAQEQMLAREYGGRYLSSQVLGVCGRDTLIIGHGGPISPAYDQLREYLDVRSYDASSGQWVINATFDPSTEERTSYLPIGPSGESNCASPCIQTARLTDGDVDVVVQGAGRTLSNGVTVLSVKNGQWRMVPFFDSPTSTGSTPYVPAASLVGNEIHVDLNDCKPSCADGHHETIAFTYDKDRQGFEGAPQG